jgi:molybdopterin-guanine dinucleotide biosynthesis protein A
VILAGGEARRLGGVNKPGIVVGDRRLLDVAIEAVADATTTIVAGPHQPTTRPVQWTRESPPGGGPVAALAAVMPLVETPTVVLLAADLPFVTPDAVGELNGARGTASAVITVDEDERDQPLLGCYATVALTEALPCDVVGASLRDVIRRLESAGEVCRLHVAARIPVTLDCDTPADVTRARELA